MSDEPVVTTPTPKCPKCGSGDIRRSKSEGAVALVQKVFGRWPFRCRSCRSRFYRTAEPPLDMDHPHDEATP